MKINEPYEWWISMVLDPVKNGFSDLGFDELCECWLLWESIQNEQKNDERH
ncbi:MAG: hypothetical protein V7731_18210 [Amphritea sp.]